MPNWDEIRKEWETTKKTYKELEKQFDVNSSTIRSRKNREKWERNATGNATQQKKSVATKNSPTVAKGKKRTTSNKRKKRSGNPNPVKQFTKRNSAAVTHGFFSKYIPTETLDIMDSLIERHPSDLIYDQITIQYAAIIRAQQIMFVNDKEDHEEFISKKKEDDFGTETQYEHHTAWDRHAKFLNAQSRAMSELRSLIKQFNELAYDDDERKIKLELMQTNIAKTKAETEQIANNDNNVAPPEITIVDAWSDDDE